MRITPTVPISTATPPPPPCGRWTAPPTAWSCGTAPPPPSRTWPFRCCPSSFPPPCGRPGRTRRSAFWWPPPATPARPPWRALPMSPRRKSWSSTPRTACPRSRRPRWSPRTGRMWASAPWWATLTTPRRGSSAFSPTGKSGRPWRSGAISCPPPTPSTGAASCPRWFTTSPPTATCSGTGRSTWGTR